MASVITSLCLYDGRCKTVCPVDCIVPGNPLDKYPQHYIDPVSCIDCGACIEECPQGAIFEESRVPSSYIASGGERLSMPAGTPGFEDVYEKITFNGAKVRLPATRVLEKGEVIDLTPALKLNEVFFSNGPGYDAEE